MNNEKMTCTRGCHSIDDPDSDYHGCSCEGSCPCHNFGPEVFPTKCKHDPRVLSGQPIGMYHCPDCGEMVLAGMKHPGTLEED